MNTYKCRAAVLFAVLFAVCGCADSAKKAFEKGDLASQHGDFDSAIANYTGSRNGDAASCKSENN